MDMDLFFIEMDVGFMHQEDFEHHEITITTDDLINLALKKVQEKEKYCTVTQSKNVTIYVKQKLI